MGRVVGSGTDSAETPTDLWGRLELPSLFLGSIGTKEWSCGEVITPFDGRNFRSDSIFGMSDRIGPLAIPARPRSRDSVFELELGV